jgi:4-hydroxyphenylacetate 3-monooxygenase
MPRNYDELVQRRKALQAWAQVSYGFMGRSPDHVASTLIGQCMGLEVFAKHGPARAKALEDYVNYATSNDLYVILGAEKNDSSRHGRRRPATTDGAIDGSIFSTAGIMWRR